MRALEELEGGNDLLSSTQSFIKNSLAIIEDVSKSRVKTPQLIQFLEIIPGISPYSEKRQVVSNLMYSCPYPRP
jgi:hypothetical protein